MVDAPTIVISGYIASCDNGMNIYNGRENIDLTLM